MPTLADMEAAKPKCDKQCGPLSERRSCGKPLRWSDRALRLAMPRNEDYMDGAWICGKHGPVMSGVDAALRAGYVPYIVIEPSEAA